MQLLDFAAAISRFLRRAGIFTTNEEYVYVFNDPRNELYFMARIIANARKIVLIGLLELNG